MYVRLLGIGALLVATFAYLFAGEKTVVERPPYIQGRNKTVLFLSSPEPGLTNVLVATAASLMEHYSDLEIHYSSFAHLQEKVERTSAVGKTKSPGVKDIVFHEVKGVRLADTLRDNGITLEDTIHPPGARGIGTLAGLFQLVVAPWNTEQHLAIYHQLSDLIDEVDPAVIVVDTLFRPALDAVRQKNRLHAFITPNTLVDNFLGSQPSGKMFWKYPAMSSGFSFPVPLRDIPENIYMNLRFIYAVVFMPSVSALKASLRQHGILDPLNFYAIHRDDVPWITQTTEGASIPIEYVPPNVTCAGPIVLSAGPAEEQDSEMASWMKKAPTVLVNLGSGFMYNENRGTAMAAAIADVLEKTDAQFIWKFRQDVESEAYDNDVALAPLKKFIDNGRMRVSSWLTVDPVSLLETGDIVASVHHGGSGCYHEAILTGVPHVILPMWADLYNFAALAEDIGVGHWACREAGTQWTRECLAQALFETVSNSPKTESRRQTAKLLGEKTRAAGVGRDIAAREVAKLAYKK